MDVRVVGTRLSIAVIVLLSRARQIGVVNMQKGDQSMSQRPTSSTSTDDRTRVHSAGEQLDGMIETVRKIARTVDLNEIDPPLEDRPWALATDTLRFIVAMIRHTKPQHILELGSGVSTRVMAWACTAEQSRCHITSVDHDFELMDLVTAKLPRDNDTEPVTYVHAPLVARQCAGVSLPMYSIRPDQLACAKPADLVVVDGPPRALGGRAGMLQQAMHHARSGSLLLLDDANRSDERKVLASWDDAFGEAISVRRLPDFVKGLAVVQIHSCLTPKDPEWGKVQRAAQRVKQVIGPSETFVLVDENRWGHAFLEDRTAMPFLERNGDYWGPPSDDDQAVAELERLRHAGAGFIVFVWPAFWWLDHYAGFAEHLETRYHCVIKSDHVVVYDLRRPEHP